MRVYGTIGAAMVLLILCTPAMATYVQDMSSSEVYSNAGWGPAYPPPGSYGGIADGECRVVWGPSETDTENWASITFPKAIYSAEIRHLDGLADDSFEVYVGTNLWGTYDDASDTETWYENTFSGAAGTTLKIVATGTKWDSFDTYGQLAIDWVEAEPIPAPGAVLLTAVGTVLVGWIRRRKAL